MTVRFQRLIIILFSLIFVTFSVLLILFNSKNNLVFFYTPSELTTTEINFDKTIRVGGFVKEGSVNYKKNNYHTFVITDKIESINVKYDGILPDLFREGQGIVIEGKKIKSNTIEASKVFAKHDENYMPASIKKQLEKNSFWKKSYK